MFFKDRQDAGKRLAGKLQEYLHKPDVVVLGLARGGVIVASEIATALHLPLNVLVVRKVGAPGNEELAIGAVTELGECQFNDQLIAMLGVQNDFLKKEVEKQVASATKRSQLYRGGMPFPNLKDKTIIIVDDGIATGASMRAAIQSIQNCHPQKIVLAVPVAAPDSLKKIKEDVDQIVCLSTPEYFQAVGSFYKIFDQTTDEEIIHLLSRYSH